MADLTERIAGLEAEIASLSDAAQRCRKISLAAKVMVAVGALLFLLILAGFFQSAATAFVLALTAVLGGLALLGSNKRTWDEVAASIRAREAQRTALIDQLGLLEINTG